MNEKSFLLNERGFLVTAIVTIAIATIVHKACEIVEAWIKGKKSPMKRWTIPIGIGKSFSINVTVGEGKPEYGASIGFKDIPITFGITAGPGRKPGWEVGIKIIDSKAKVGKTTTRFKLMSAHSWTGSKISKAEHSIKASYSKTRTPSEMQVSFPKIKGGQKFKIGSSYNWTTQKFSVDFEKDLFKGSLTKPKAGKPTIDLDVLLYRYIDPVTGKERDIAVGARVGKGKPIWKFEGGIDLSEKYRIQFNKDFNNLLDDTGLTFYRYKVLKGERKKVAQKFTVGQKEYTTKAGKKIKKSYLTFKGKDFIPISINLKEGETTNFVIDTDHITNYFVTKLFPEAKGKTWQEKVGYSAGKPFADLWDKMRGKDVPQMTPEGLTQFTQQYFKDKKIGLPEWFQRELYEKVLYKTPDYKWGDKWLKPQTLAALKKSLQAEQKEKLPKVETKLWNDYLAGKIPFSEVLFKSASDWDELIAEWPEKEKAWYGQDFNAQYELKKLLDAPPAAAVNAIKNLMKHSTEGMKAFEKEFGRRKAISQVYDYDAWKERGWFDLDTETQIELKKALDASPEEAPGLIQKLIDRSTGKVKTSFQKLAQEWEKFHFIETPLGFWKEFTEGEKFSSWKKLGEPDKLWIQRVFANAYTGTIEVFKGMEGVGSKIIQSFTRNLVTKKAKYSDMGEDGIILAERLGVPLNTEFEYRIPEFYDKLLTDPWQKMRYLGGAFALGIRCLGAPFFLGYKIGEEAEKKVNEWSNRILESHPLLKNSIPEGLFEQIFIGPAALVGATEEFAQDPLGFTSDVWISLDLLGKAGNLMKAKSAAFGKKWTGKFTRSGKQIWETTPLSDSVYKMGEGLKQFSKLNWLKDPIVKSAKYGMEKLRELLPGFTKKLDSAKALNEIIAKQQILQMGPILDAEITARQATKLLKAIPKKHWDDLRYYHSTGTPKNLWPEHLKTKQAFEVSNKWKAMEIERQAIATNTGILSKTQMENRYWKEAIEKLKKPRIELEKLGYQPDYLPQLSEQMYSSPMQQAFKAFTPKFLKKYTKDLTNIPKKALDKAIFEHHTQFVQQAFKQNKIEKMLQYGQNQGIIKTWKPDQPLLKGYKIWDPHGATAKETEFLKAGDIYCKNLAKLDDMDKAMGLTLKSMYGSQEKINKAMSTLKKFDYDVYQVPNWYAGQITSELGIFPTWARPFEWFASATDYWKRAVLSLRPATYVGDIKDNLIRVSTRINPVGRLGINWLDKKHAPLISEELLFRGRSADILRGSMKGPSTSAWAEVMDVVSLKKFARAMGKARSAQDRYLHQTLAGFHTERLIKQQVAEQWGINYTFNSQRLKQLSIAKIEKLVKNPKKYAGEIAALQDDVMKIVNDTVYDASTILPLLSPRAHKILGTVFPFHEFAIDCLKKAALLGIKRPYQTTILREIGKIHTHYFQEEGERPEQHQVAARLADNLWFSWLGGGFYSPNFGGLQSIRYDEETGEYALNPPVNPYVESVIEYFTGKDLNFEKFFTTPGQEFAYDFDTAKMKLVTTKRNAEEVRAEITGHEKAIDTLLGELSGPMAKYLIPNDYYRIFNEIDNYRKKIDNQLKPELETIELGLGTVHPSVINRMLEKFPQYSLLVDFLQPFTKYDTSTLIDPEIRLDRYGNPKKELTLDNWCRALRMLGVSVYPHNVERWEEIQKKNDAAEGRKTYADFARFVGNVAYTDPELFERMKKAIIDGTLPVDWSAFQPWTQWVDERIGSASKLAPLTPPLDFWDTRREYTKMLTEAKNFEKRNVDIEIQEAIDSLDFTDEELNKKLTMTLKVARDERKRQIDEYYTYVSETDQYMRMYQDLKEAEELKDKLEALTEVTTTRDLIDNIKENFKQLTGKIPSASTIEVGEILANYLIDLVEKGKTPDLSEFSKRISSLLKTDYEQSKELLMKILVDVAHAPKSILDATAASKKAWAEDRLKELAWIEMKRSITGATPRLKPLSLNTEQILAEDIFNYYLGDKIINVEEEMKKILSEEDLNLTRARIELKTQETIEKIREANLPWGDMVIKAVRKKASSTKSRIRRRYKSRQRIQQSMAKNTLEQAKEALEKAISERSSFLTASTFQHWAEFFDPSQVVDDKEMRIPLSAILTGLAGVRVETHEKLGAGKFKAFMSSPEGEMYEEFESIILKALEDLLKEWEVPMYSEWQKEKQTGYWFPFEKDTGVITAMNKFYGAYQAIKKKPSMAALKDLYGLHELSTADSNLRIPVIKWNEDTQDVKAVFHRPKKWSSELLGGKFKELEQYSRTFTEPVYQMAERTAEKSLVTLERKLRAGEQTAWFTGFMLMK